MNEIELWLAAVGWGAEKSNSGMSASSFLSWVRQVVQITGIGYWVGYISNLTVLRCSVLEP